MYLSRKDLLARKWELTDIQAFEHDCVKKSETGRGRPSYLYLVSRVEQKEKGLPVDNTEIQINAAMDLADRNDAALLAALDKAPSLAPVKPKLFLVPAVSEINKLPCSVPVAITEPSAFAPYVQVNGTVEIAKAKPTRASQNPNAVKLDLRSFPKGPKVIIVDTEGNESLYQG